MRVLITGARAPVAIEWATIFSRQGHQVIMTDSLSQPLGSFLGSIERYIPTTSPRFSFADYQKQILNIIEQYKVDMVVPTCEEVFYLTKIVQLKPEIDWLMPDSEILLALHNKLSVFNVLNGLPEVSFPVTQLITRREHVTLNKYTVLKPLYSRFGNQVIRDVSLNALSGIEFTAKAPWVQQQKICGQPICNYALFERGKLRVHQAYVPKYCVNKSAATAFKPIEDTSIERFIRAFGQRFSYHGQVSFDFIRDKSGLYIIECNPRATSGLHIVAPFCLTTSPRFEFSVPKINQLHHLGPAMLVAGGIPSIFSQTVWRDYVSGKYAMKPHRKALPAFAQIFSLLELYKISKKQRISLSQATTYDIEWNNEDW